ncbi:unnamed protein product [Rhodiola kirilowii]
MSDQEQQLPNIPHDIMVDILSRLPAKSLLKFRCVCKSWNSMIRNQKFTEFHLKRTMANASQQRVLLSVKPFWSIKYDDLDDFGKDGFDVIIKKDTPSSLGCLGSNNDFELVGHCNGLICIVLRKGRRSHQDPIERTFCLWNPSTNECWQISSDDVANDIVSSNSMFRGEYYNRFEIFGFGYDLTIDDYKIVRLISYDELDVVQVEIFTIGRRTWRKEEFHLDYVVNLLSYDRIHDCLFLNGALHWINTLYYVEQKEILSFNLEQEQLQVMRIDRHAIKSLFNRTNLRVISGKLVLVTNPGDTEIWVMDEYGVETSWTKKATLRAIPCDGMWGAHEKLSPLCFSKKGDILVRVRDFHYMMYDLERKIYRKAGGNQLNNRPHSSMYVESLISPNRIPNVERREPLS